MHVCMVAEDTVEQFALLQAHQSKDIHSITFCILSGSCTILTVMSFFPDMSKLLSLYFVRNGNVPVQL